MNGKQKQVAGKPEIADRAMFEKLEDMERSLCYLRYEGKVHYSKNVRHVGQLYRQLKETLESHRKKEEKVLFPFLAAHMPRLGPALKLFHMDHEEAVLQMSGLDRRLAELQNPGAPRKRAQSLSTFHESGLYLVHFLKNHLEMEQGLLGGTVRRDLREDERRRLARLAAQNLRQKRKRRKSRRVLKSGRRRGK